MIMWLQHNVTFHNVTHGNQGAVSIRKTVLSGMALPLLKIRRHNGRLIFNMEIAIRRWDGLYIETGPSGCYLDRHGSNRSAYPYPSITFRLDPTTWKRHFFQYALALGTSLCCYVEFLRSWYFTMCNNITGNCTYAAWYLDFLSSNFAVFWIYVPPLLSLCLYGLFRYIWQCLNQTCLYHRMWKLRLLWWRHDTETLYSLLALCEGNPPGFPSQRASNAGSTVCWC